LALYWRYIGTILALHAALLALYSALLALFPHFIHFIHRGGKRFNDHDILYTTS
jgi:hypothetical protein